MVQDMVENLNKNLYNLTLSHMTNNTLNMLPIHNIITSFNYKSDNDTNDNTDIDPPFSMDQLYIALIKCFAIIICGYLAGRMNIISSSEAKGLNTFVGTFALPSLIFLSLVELNWTTVNWSFLLSILISKSIVFFIVIIVTLLIARPLNYARAGLLAVFCTQSNDFAIGYPIVAALYSKLHPEYASYIYLVAPISLAVLNPIGYVLMEITKLHEKENANKTIENQSIETTDDPINSTIYSSRPEIVPPCIQQQHIEESRKEENRFLKGNCLIIVKTIESIFFNPILLMTILGVIGGVAFPNGLPEVLSSTLRVLGNSFSGTALFLLGLRMVGKAHELQGSGFLLPGILIIVKLLVLPLVTRQTVNLMNAGGNLSETTDLSTFGFLYGTFPAAPGVFVIAARYNIDVDLTASSMVACTFISAPLMFISAKMISLTNLNPSDYLNELNEIAFDISIIGICACIWLLIVFIITRKIKRMPHRITSCLIISQLISSIGILLWSTMETTNGWPMYLQFCFFTIGNYSSLLWTAFLAITLLFLQCRSLCFVLKLWPTFIGFAWGVPTLIVGILLIIDRENITPSEKRNPNFQYGNAQAAISVFLLVMCFIVTVGCLVLHQRYKKRYQKYLTLSREVSTPETDYNITSSSSTANLIEESPENNESNNLHNNTRSTQCNDNEAGNNCCNNSNSNSCSTIQTNNHSVDIEDLVPSTRKRLGNNNADIETIDNDMDIIGPNINLCSSQFNCPGPSRQACQSLIENYQENINDGLEPIENDNDDIDKDIHQTLKHTVLLILLLCSMFVGLALSVWTLVMEGMSGIYVELTFLDGFLNYGQGIIVLAVFITDTSNLLMPVIKYWHKLVYGNNQIKLPLLQNLSNETKITCEQFVKYHLIICRQQLAKDKRWRIKVYKKCFYGNDLINWLIQFGLAKDRMDGLQYGKHLIDGRVLRHINNAYHFHDKKLLYTFCNKI